MKRVRPKRRAKKVVRTVRAAHTDRMRHGRVVDDIEDRLLAAKARKALADRKRIPYAQVRRGLGLD